jgi:hypothetical protein
MSDWEKFKGLIIGMLAIQAIVFLMGYLAKV